MKTNSSGTTSVNLIKQYSNTNYQIIITQGVYTNTGTDIRSRYVQNKTVSSFNTSSASGINFNWFTFGYIA